MSQRLFVACLHKFVRFTPLLFAATLGIQAARAQEVKPALVYDFGGRFDASFNESAYRGAEKFKKDTGIAYRDFEIQNDSQREQALREFARRGHFPIVAVGFAQGAAVAKVAKEFPNARFAIVDFVVSEPNVRSIVFKENESSYLAGMMAAMSSKSDTLGFIGGMDVPLIRKFSCAYIGGVKAVKPNAQVLVSWTGTTGDAWNNPTRGAELARSQFSRGVETVYAVAGGTSIGILQAAADSKKLSIGEASNQNSLHPGSVLTSVVKHLDLAVYNSFMDAKKGTFSPGVQALGLADGGVEVAMDENNKPVVSAQMRKAVADVTGQIISGSLKVHNYLDDQKCPYGG